MLTDSAAMTPDFTEDQVLALARRAYAEGDARVPLRPERSALLVIDMQDEIVRELPGPA